MSPPNFTRTLFLHATRGPASPLARNLSLRIPRLSSSVQYFSSSPFSRPPIHLNQTVPLHRLQHHSLSTMSSAPAKKEFLCIVPDKPGAIAKRIEVRPAHLDAIKPLVASGAVVAGGAMFNSHPAEGETPSYKGSMMLAMAENEAEVRELLARDIYGTSGVWDLENAQIFPFKSAIREPL